MHTEVLTIPRKTLLREAVETMAEHQCSYLLIIEAETPVGILTERDIVRAFAREIQGQPLSGMDVDALMTPMPMCLNEEASFEFALSLSHSRKLRHLPVIDAAGRLVGLVTQRDLLNAFGQLMEFQSKLEQKIEHLRTLTLEDALLGIGNRRAMEVELSFTEAESRRHHRSYAVALMDIDFFKKYNDRYGHQQGDLALQQVARCIQATVRESDRVFRYGGEEILILMPETELTAALHVADRVRSAVLEQQIEHQDGVDQVLTISGGIAVLQEGDWHTMVRLADQALYRAKHDGRNCVRVAQPGST
jgi:diguanylate cyclase (GGDEF)-like protein